MPSAKPPKTLKPCFGSGMGDQPAANCTPCNELGDDNGTIRADEDDRTIRAHEMDPNSWDPRPDPSDFQWDRSLFMGIWGTGPVSQEV